MLKAVTRIGDRQAGHDECPAVPLATAESRVTIFGISVGCVGDLYEPHRCDDHALHQGVISSGGSGITAFGRSIARIGDSVSCGSATSFVAEGDPRVLVGDCDASQGIEAAYQANKARITAEAEENRDEKALTILCLPDIASAVAETRSSAYDRKGWNYLSSMMKKWLAGKGSADLSAGSPFVIDSEWMLKYSRAAAAKTDLTENFFNEAAKKELSSVLGQENVAQTGYFDHVSAEGTDIFSLSHQSRSVGSYIDAYGYPDGLTACMGKFNLVGLASGTVSGETVTISKAAVRVYDTFSFGDNGILSGYLGAWDCKSKSFGYAVGVRLSDSDFRTFREKYGAGADFIVTSDLLDVTDDISTKSIDLL